MPNTRSIQLELPDNAKPEPLFRDLASSIPHLLWTCQADGPCDYLSPQWVEYTGIPARAQLGSDWLQQLHPEDVEPTRVRWAAAVAAGQPFDTEFRIRRSDGVYRWFKTRAVPAKDANGRITSWLGTNTDIQDLEDARATATRLNQELEQRVTRRTEELRAANERLETLAVQLQTAQRLTNVGSWELDLETGAVRWSDELFRIFGMAPEAGPPSYAEHCRLFTPESWSRLHGAVEQARVSGVAYHLVLTAIGRDGEPRTTTALGEPLRGRSGRIEQLVGTFQDITAQVRSDQKVRELSERLQLATSAANIGVWDWDMVKGTVLWDETMQRLHETPPFPPEQVLETWQRSLLAEDADRVHGELDAALRGGHDFESTFRIRCPNGKVKHIRASARVERDVDGRPVRMIGVNWDITEQRVAEIALRQSEALQRALLAHAGPAIIATYANGEIHLFNRAAEELLGYSAQEVIGTATPVLVHDPVEIEARRSALQQELSLVAVDAFDALVLRSRERGPDAAEWSYVRKDGSRVPVLLTVTTLRDDAGLITGYLGVAVNLTQRKAQERELLELNRLLGERTVQMEVLLQEIHHRVKNNLQVIASLVSLQQRQVSDASARIALTECKTRIQAFALIHQQLYQSSDYSRIPFSQYAEQLGHRIVAATGVDRQRVRLAFDTEPVALPVEKAIPCGLILNELLTNAFKHAFPDGRSGEVTVSLHLSPDAALTLAVADDGIGLGKDFELERCGTLGLHLVRDLAAQLDGHIFIGKANGTLIGVTVPFKREQTKS